QEYRTGTLKGVVAKYFNNSYLGVVSSLIEEESLSVDELRKLIEQVEQGNKKIAMGFFFVYILKSTTYILLFYLFYKLLLSRETFFRFNRLALLGISAFSFILPFFKLSKALPAQQSTLFSLPVDITEMGSEPGQQAAASILFYVLPGIYLAGLFFFFFRTILSFIRLYRLFRQEGIWMEKEGVKIGIVETCMSPFSWMNRIVISRKEWEENQEAILIHEKGHIQARHSWDLVWMQICGIVTLV
ncbi:MAG: hypothetical protein LIP01_14955, partial [Tannerellaceae bacterium]|nr:hypothetical protein [Tannerellaceae bacterium]